MEYDKGRTYWSNKTSGTPFLVSNGGVGIDVLVNELSTAGIDELTKERSLRLVRIGRTLVTDFYQQGGVIGLDGQPFILGLDNLNQFINHPEGLRRVLERNILISYRGLRPMREFNLDVEKLGIHPNKRIYFAKAGADEDLAYELTEGHGLSFGIPEKRNIMGGLVTVLRDKEILAINKGLRCVLAEEEGKLSGETAIAFASIINQSVFDLILAIKSLPHTEQSNLSRVDKNQKTPNSGLLARLLSLFRLRNLS